MENFIFCAVFVWSNIQFLLLGLQENSYVKCNKTPVLKHTNVFVPWVKNIIQEKGYNKIVIFFQN